MQTKEIITSI